MQPTQMGGPPPHVQPTQYNAPQQPYQPPANPQPGYQYGAQPQASASNTLSIVGIVLGAFSLFRFQLLFGAAGIVLGIVGMSKGEKLGKIAIIVSACCMVAGFLIRTLIMIATIQAISRLAPMPPR